MEYSKKMIDELMDILGLSVMGQVKTEALNQDYEALSFNAGTISVRSRLAKKTPTKAGYFVVFWVKDEQGKNRPYRSDECKDKLVILVEDGDKRGQFVFPKHVLEEQGIVTTDTKKGKMAMRVYSSWEKDLNAQATKTQKWQVQYFAEEGSPLYKERLQELFK